MNLNSNSTAYILLLVVSTISVQLYFTDMYKDCMFRLKLALMMSAEDISNSRYIDYTAF